jgi:hypothetical protein|tara:strand:- start:3866 stop:4696 length:831 start_codon:yes stop_codon:yes gene_type:complete
MEKTKEFLKAIGVDLATIEAITAVEPAEDLNVEELSKQYITNQKSLSANDPELIKGIKDEIRGTELSKIEHKIKKQFNLSPDEVRDKKFEEILETAYTKIQKESGSTSEELQAKILELNKAVKQYEEEILPAERNKSKQEISKFRRDLAIRDALSKKSLIVGSDVILPALNATLDQYEIVINEDDKIEIKTKDGLKPLSKDGTKTLTFEEIVDNQLNEMNVVRQSNAEPGADKIVKKEPTFNEGKNEEKSSNYYLPGLKKAKQNAESLKEIKTFGL